jgi:O-antigen/teichoic acid export membrane protein
MVHTQAQRLATELSRSARRAAKVSVAVSSLKYLVLMASQLLFVPIYLHYVGLEGYGAWIASGNMVALLGILDFGFNLAVTQRLSSALGARDVGRFLKDCGAAAGIAACGFTLASGVSLIVSPWVPYWIHCPSAHIAALRIAIIMAGVGTGARIVGLTLWSLLQAWRMAFASEVAFLASAGLGLAATLWGLRMGLGIVAFGVGELLSGALPALVLMPIAWAEWRRRKLGTPLFQPAECIAVFREVSPLIVSRTLTSAVTNAQPAIISMCLGPAAAAVLSLTGRTYSACQSLLNPLAISALPGIARLHGEGATERVLSVMRELSAVITVAASIMFGTALALNGDFGTLWVGADRFGGATLSAFLCLAMLLVSANNVQTVILTALGEIRSPAWCSLVELVCRFAIMLALMPALAVMSAPVATCISSTAITTWFLLRILAKRLGASLGVMTRIVCTGLPGLAVALALGYTASRVLPVATSWKEIAGRGLLVGAGLVALSVALNGTARDLAARTIVCARSRFSLAELQRDSTR